MFLDPDGRLVAAVALDIADDLVQTVRAVSNPEKLTHLGVFADPPGPESYFVHGSEMDLATILLGR